MATVSRPPKRRNDVLPSLNTAINALDLARDTTNLEPVREAFCSASALLAATKVCFPPVHVGRLLADVRRTR